MVRPFGHLTNLAVASRPPEANWIVFSMSSIFLQILSDQVVRTTSFGYGSCWFIILFLFFCFLQSINFLVLAPWSKIRVWIYFWVVYSISLVYVAVFMLIPCWLVAVTLWHILNDILRNFQHCSFCSGLFILFRFFCVHVDY
jgi:hypothetical protein